MENELTVREVVEGTIAKVQENMQMLVVFVLTLTVLGTALQGGFFFLGDGDIAGFEIPSFVLTAFGISAGIAGIALLIVAIVASYLLWELLLRRAGYYPPDSERRFFRYVAQAILIGIGTGLGFMLLVIPGLIFGARWAAAPAFLIANKRGTIESMGDSWDMVSGNTTPVVLAYLTGVAIIVVLGLVLNITGFGLVSIFFENLVSNIGTVLTIAMGVFLYDRLHGRSETLSQVFD
ncbi:hypothetical protein [Erythrobacter sp. EC-HK427]|uniref:hypothetical protein n=1 Tax=Erythrobacter sp. EC-HK427 TaxID=2038396 RepID=UPI001259B633|nr:hypothetical protein [Erythrobacter sp. EC-HK427]VVT17702.1 membrane hypothetical protein [Erythrobacter sp. EC-HK427]